MTWDLFQNTKSNSWYISKRRFQWRYFFAFSFTVLSCLSVSFSFKCLFSGYSIYRQVQKAHEEYLEHHCDSDGGWVQDNMWLYVFVEFWWLKCVFVDYALCKGSCYLSQSNSPPFFSLVTCLISYWVMMKKPSPVYSFG